MKIPFTKATILAACLLSFTPAKADPHPELHVRAIATLTVSETSSIVSTPDVATINAIIVIEAPTSTEAMNSNDKTIKAVTTTLSRIGINKDAIQTSNLSVAPSYGINRLKETELKSYTLTNTLRLKTSNFDFVGPSMDALVKTGVSYISVEFTSSEEDILHNQARVQAIKKAKKAAHAMAEAADSKLGKITEFNVTTQNVGQNSYIIKAKKPGIIPSSSYSRKNHVASGQQKINVTANLVYEIE